AGALTTGVPFTLAVKVTNTSTTTASGTPVLVLLKGTTTVDLACANSDCTTTLPSNTFTAFSCTKPSGITGCTLNSTTNQVTITAQTAGFSIGAGATVTIATITLTP